jgi:hypothetical protein
LPDADGRARIGPIKNTTPMKSPDSKYLIDAPAFSEHHGREWPTNKTTDIYLSAINLQRSPFLAEIRVNATESRFAACLNRLLQQNRSKTDSTARPR